MYSFMYAKKLNYMDNKIKNSRVHFGYFSQLAPLNGRGKPSVFWSWVSDRRSRDRFQMPPKTQRVHTVYILAKSVVPKVPQSLVSSLPRDTLFGIFRRDPCAHLREFRRKPRKNPNGQIYKSERGLNREPLVYQFESTTSHSLVGP